jgi:hypothetical protein
VKETTPEGGADPAWGPWFATSIGPMLLLRAIDARHRAKGEGNEMKVKMLIVTAAVAITGVVAPNAIAAGKASTEVTIQGQNGDYFGYVKSSKSSCESDRKVNVFKMLGSSPSPQTDQKIGSDTSQPNGPDGMWSIGNSGYKKGKFYAKVRNNTECKGDLSPVITRN